MGFWSLAGKKLSHHGDLEPEEEKKERGSKEGCTAGGRCKVIKESESKRRGQSNEISFPCSFGLRANVRVPHNEDQSGLYPGPPLPLITSLFLIDLLSTKLPFPRAGP